MEFTFAGNRRDGYISAVRPEGYGDLDLYKVTFNEMAIRQTILKGRIGTEDSLKQLTATITVYDAATNNEIASRDIDGSNMKYIFLLSPGKYILKVTAETFADYSETISILDKSDYVMEKEKDIVLLRPGSAGHTTEPKKGKPKPAAKKPQQ
jgi:hypothetical protein